jgi:hypothetical protein
VFHEVVHHPPDRGVLLAERQAAELVGPLPHAVLRVKPGGLHHEEVAPGRQHALHEQAHAPGDLLVGIGLMREDHRLAEQRLLELVEPGVEALVELVFFHQVGSRVHDVVDAVAIEARHVGHEAAGELHAEQGGEVEDAVGVFRRGVLPAFLGGFRRVGQLVGIERGRHEREEVALQPVGQAAGGGKVVDQLADEAGAPLHELGDAGGRGEGDVAARGVGCHVVSRPGLHHEALQLVLAALEQLQPGSRHPGPRGIVDRLGAEDEQELAFLAELAQRIDRREEAERLHHMDVLQLEHGRNLPRDRRHDLGERGERVVGGNRELHLVGAGLGHVLLHAVDEHLEPALLTLAVERELPEQRQLDLSAQDGVAVERAAEAGVERLHRRVAIHVLGEADADGEHVLVFRKQAQHLADQHTLAGAERPLEHDVARLPRLCRGVVGLERGEFGGTGDVDGFGQGGLRGARGGGR